ncbi:MAG: DoxX family protein [Candidatus Peregrinibacteria bacterium]|nr:DoxX family protein [Candidatus Peregrinibacteria bacterium]
MIDFLLSLQSYGDWGLLVLRLAIGIIFLYHAKAKVGGKMGGFLQCIGFCEVAGGLAMVMGFLTQLAAMGLGIIMLGAIYKKINEWHIPFWSQNNTGWEFDFLILASCIALIFLGPGSMAVDPGMFGL